MGSPGRGRGGISLGQGRGTLHSMDTAGKAAREVQVRIHRELRLGDEGAHPSSSCPPYGIGRIKRLSEIK